MLSTGGLERRVQYWNEAPKSWINNFHKPGRHNKKKESEWEGKRTWKENHDLMGFMMPVTSNLGEEGVNNSNGLYAKDECGFIACESGVCNR